MICRRRLVAATIGILLLAGFVRADMLPVGNVQVERARTQHAQGQAEVSRTHLSGLYDRSMVHFKFGSIQLASDNNAVIDQPAQVPQHAIDLTGGPGSVSLCLYALMGLGLCGAPRWIKRLHLGHLPEWYHDGGPFQIGHSFAATPESLCKFQTCCFIPPDNTAEFLIPRYRLRAIVSCWRKSQFTPDVIASRGPPDMS